MKNVLRLALLAAAAASAGCMGGRRIYHVEGCNRRLELREKREACRTCVERPMPYVYLADAPEGQRCVPR